MDIDARAFGQLEGEVSGLRDMLLAQNAASAALALEQSKSMAAMALQIENMSKAMSEAKGGWKTAIWLAGMAASIGGAVTWLFSHIPFK